MFHFDMSLDFLMGRLGGALMQTQCLVGQELSCHGEGGRGESEAGACVSLDQVEG